MNSELVHSVIDPELLGAAHIPNAGHISSHNPNVVNLPSGPTHVTVTGSDSPSAQTVLFIHGAGTSGRVWLPMIQTADIQQDFELVTFDLEGHGLSPWNGGASGEDYLVQKWAKTAEQVLDHCGAKDAYVVAHGVGAYVALLLAAKNPQRIKALMLVNPVVAVQSDHRGKLAKTLRRLLHDKGIPAVVGDMSAERLGMNEQANTTASVFLVAQYYGTPPQVFANAIIAQIGPEPDYTALRSVKTVVVAGQDDRIVPKTARDNLKQALMDHAYYAELPVIGHFAMLEDTGATAELLRVALGI